MLEEKVRTALEDVRPQLQADGCQDQAELADLSDCQTTQEACPALEPHNPHDDNDDERIPYKDE